MVGRSQNENLTHQLIDFLVGEKDGVPKDQNYIYRLYLALKKYEDAAKTALIIGKGVPQVISLFVVLYIIELMYQ